MLTPLPGSQGQSPGGHDDADARLRLYLGGPGSPAAGGRNAIMIAILSDYGINLSFGQRVMYCPPFVPVAAIAVGLYFYLWGLNKIKINAIIFALAKDYEAGEQLITMKDFFFRGFMVLLLSFVLLWVWLILGYWQLLKFPV